MTKDFYIKQINEMARKAEQLDEHTLKCLYTYMKCYTEE